jgi:hypothetical protein
MEPADEANRLGWAQRVLLGVFALLFGWAAYLQVNDVGAVIWMGVYGYAAVVAAIGAAGRRVSRWWLGASVTATVCWAAYLAVVIFVMDAATPMHPAKGGGKVGLLAMEEGREMFGLLIIAASFGVQFAGRSADGTATDSG